MSVRATTGTTQIRRRDRARRVWIALFLSTVGFLGLCGFVATALYGYLSSVTVPQTATLELRQGTQLTVQRHGLTTSELVTGTTRLREGDQARTGPDSEGFIQLFGSDITVATYFSTSLRLTTLRTSRFFQNNRRMQIDLDSGTVVVATGNSGDYNDESYIISTSDADVSVGRGSKVRVRADGPGVGMSAVVDLGTATVFSKGRRVDLTAGQMAFVDEMGALSGPAPASENLIANGDFTDPPTREADKVQNGGLGTAVWEPFREEVSGDDPTLSSVLVLSETVNGPTVYAVAFVREAAKDTPQQHYARLGIHQEINQPVSYLSSIVLKATVRVITQSNVGSGPLGNVYPLTIKVNYTNTERKPASWSRNFYYVEGTPKKSDAGQLRQARWAGSQFTLKSKDVGLDIAVIDSIEIYGYGTEFQSWITGISMVAH